MQTDTFAIKLNVSIHFLQECKKIFSRLNKSNDKVENSTSGKRSAEDVEMDVDSSGPNDLK